MLPSVDEVLSDNRIVEIINEYPRSLVLESVREVIDLKRQFILRLKEDASN
ncbi:L-seryl-tRNA(Sec) selenium transferase, partial [Clostridioides difficile]|nr:L-seryl-tRNA(Sec) selenium transferase [Clostridioides difficile]